MGWFSVRHVIQSNDSFEERITLWEAPSAEAAIGKAAKDAAEHVAMLGEPCKVLDLFQSFELFSSPGDSVEVFSLIRDSDLTAD